MRIHRVSSGFLLSELVVVLIVLLMVAVLLVPVFTRDKRDEQSVCTSNVRQMATAVQMFCQDNNGHFPDDNWARNIEVYLGSPRIFFCPADTTEDVEHPVSYGYSGLLLRATAEGVNEAQITAPTEVGAVCDAAPTKPLQGKPGIVGGGGLLGKDRIAYPFPRHDGVVVGYCDGHAKLVSCTLVNPRDMGNEVSRAFYQVNGLGMVQNPAGGLRDFTPVAAAPTRITLGGDYCTMPLLMAAAEAWQAKTKAEWDSQGFKGQLQAAGRREDYLWGHGDGIAPKGPSVAIARDALVVIVSRNSKIPQDMLPRDDDGQPVVDAAVLRTLYGQGYIANRVQCYTFDTFSGSRRFFANCFKDAKGPLSISDKALPVENDLDLVEKVANDPYGIGYCSAVFADSEKVIIAAVKDAKGAIVRYPANDTTPARRWVVPVQPSWPLVRTLYVSCGGASLQPEKRAGIADNMLTPGSPGLQALHDGPLFKAGYYKAEGK